MVTSELNEPEVVALPGVLGVAGVADACRSAVQQFMNAVAARRASKLWLAGWLQGPYAAATDHGRPPMTARAVERAPPSSGPQSGTLPVAELQSTLEGAYRVTLQRLLELRVAPEPTLALIEHALRAGLVARCQDARGAKGFVPVDRPGNRLAHRLYSLVLADYFVRPDDYAGQLAICARCSTIEFCAFSRARGYCGIDSGSNRGFAAVKVA
jgi:hypothetical protein